MSKLEKAFAKITPGMLKFANAKPTQAIKDGFILTVPLTLVGSIFLLLSNIPVDGYADFMAGIFGENWAVPLNQVVGSTFDIIALVGVFGIAYIYVKNEGYEPTAAGLLGLVSMLILSNAFVVAETGEQIGGVIPKEFMGGQGMIAAIIIGLSVGIIYSWFMKRDIRIKMPDGVPQGVANAFTALIPAAVIMTLSMLVFIFCNSVFEVTLIEKIYEVLQTPIQNMSDTWVTAIIVPLLISLLWWCGIHGATIVMGIMGPIFLSNGLANQAVLDAGEVLVVGENARIMTGHMIDQFVTITGSGLTVGLVLAMILTAKSAHFKQLGKLSIFPGIFNINEPILFGTPIVFNPIMLVPFILVPILGSAIAYIAVAVGFMGPFAGVVVPWTTPPIISGFIIGGWRAAVVQIGIIAMSTAVYMPFMKMQDKISYEQELAAQKENETEVNM